MGIDCRTNMSAKEYKIMERNFLHSEKPIGFENGKNNSHIKDNFSFFDLDSEQLEKLESYDEGLFLSCKDSSMQAGYGLMLADTGGLVYQSEDGSIQVDIG